MIKKLNISLLYNKFSQSNWNALLDKMNEIIDEINGTTPEPEVKPVKSKPMIDIEKYIPMTVPAKDCYTKINIIQEEVEAPVVEEVEVEAPIVEPEDKKKAILASLRKAWLSKKKGASKKK